MRSPVQIWISAPAQGPQRVHTVGLTYRGIAQLVEQRSPKPRAEGSNPSTPASEYRVSALDTRYFYVQNGLTTLNFTLIGTKYPYFTATARRDCLLPAGLLLCFLFNAGFKESLHPVCAVALHLFGGVDVPLQGEGGCGMAHIGLYGFHIVAVYKGQCGVGMPLRYNYDKPEKPRRIKGFEVFSLSFSSFSKPKNHTEISRIAGGVSLTTNE